MKKIFTLAFALGTFTLAMAQPGNRGNQQQQTRTTQPDQRDFNKGYDNGKTVSYDNRDGRHDDRFDDRFSMERKRDMEIASINREYDYKVQRVRNSFFLFRFEKQRQVSMLEQQRQYEIRKVYAKYADRRGGYNDWDNRNNNNGRDNHHY